MSYGELVDDGCGATNIAYGPRLARLVRRWIKLYSKLSVSYMHIVAVLTFLSIKQDSSIGSKASRLRTTMPQLSTSEWLRTEIDMIIRPVGS